MLAGWIALASIGGAVVGGHAGVGASGSSPTPPLVTSVPGDHEFSGRVIVKPRTGKAGDRGRARLAATLIRHEAAVDEYIVRTPAGQSDAQYVQSLRATGDYQYVTPDWRCFPASDPNDPSLATQWHHVRMNSDRAWEISTGSHDVVIAIVDTGVDLTHPDLMGARLPGYNAASRLAEVDGGDVSDLTGHGTHVAGDAVAIGNNGVGVCGMGWNLSFMMIRNTNDPGGVALLSDILDGARWAVDHGAKVVNVSFTGVSDPSVQTTGEYIRGQGGILCFAAGNSNHRLDTFDHADVVIVGASDMHDHKASFSSYGPAVDLFAPGELIYSTMRGGVYGYGTGTSMATPIVAGAVGMIWSVNPALTSMDVESLLYAGCDDLGDPGDDDVFGHGRLNLFNTLKLAQATMGPHAPYAVMDESRCISGEVFAFDVLANDFDANDEALAIDAFDEVTVGGGTVVRSVGTGPGGRDLLLYLAPPSPFAGADSFTYTLINQSGLVSTGEVRITDVDPSTFRSPENPPHTSAGLKTEYFELADPISMPDFTGLAPIVTGMSHDVDFAVTDGPFAESGLAQNVGAVFTGYLTIEHPGWYTLWTCSDDGSRLYLGSDLIVDNDGVHEFRETSGEIALQAGKHACRIEYFQSTGESGLVVKIQGANMQKQVVPAELWSHWSCPCDWNHEGGLNSQDLFDYITAFFTFDADFNGDGTTNSQDFFDFLACFFATCG